MVLRSQFGSDCHTSQWIDRWFPLGLLLLSMLPVNVANVFDPLLPSFQVPAQPPHVTSCRNLTSTSIRCEWDPPPVDSLQGPLVKYRIRMNSKKSDCKDKAIEDIEPDATIYDIDGLSMNCLYEISMAVFNNHGWSPPTKQQITTDEGKPTSSPKVTNALPLSSSSLKAYWEPPVEPNGRIVAYRLRYYQYGIGDDRGISVELAGDASNYKITGLSPYTKYSLQIAASTRKGEGPLSASTYQYTDTAAPGVPTLSNISLNSLNSLNGIKISWHAPNDYHNIIHEYSIMISGANSSFVFDTVEKSITLRLSQKINYGERYMIQAKAATRSIIDHTRLFYGKYCRPEAFIVEEFRYDSMPQNVQKDSPVQYASMGYDNFIKVSTSLCRYVNTSMPSYTIASKLYSVTYCIHDLRSEAYGSDLKGKDSSQALSSWAAVIVVAILVVVTISFMLCFFVVYKRKRKSLLGYSRTSDGGTESIPPLCPSTISSDVAHSVYDEDGDGCVPVEEFSNQVAALEADSGIGYSREYELIEHDSLLADKLFTSTVSNINDNRTKNRYINIASYDHTRVILDVEQLDVIQEDQTDYVNANFVDGYNSHRAYIATQGPLPNTMGDFWLMIWQQKVQVVVMITNLMERGRKKCDQYWPLCIGIPEYYGAFEVRLVEEHSFAFYSHRSFLVRFIQCHGCFEERHISQFQYSQWPDHGVPSHALPVLTFIRKSLQANCTGGPVLVHCSAGVGRSGTYIVIASMLQQIKHRQTVNVFGFLKHIRQQRNYLVQTEEQYIFCYEAILEAVKCGDTEVFVDDLAVYVDHNLAAKCCSGRLSVLERQFELATQWQPSPSDRLAALQAVNQDKNAEGSLLPVEQFRVKLTPQITTSTTDPSSTPSDYINATYICGYLRSNQFILAQQPLQNSINAFWQMIWEQNCQTVVLLSAISSQCPQFWPEADVQHFDCSTFTVRMTESRAGDSLIWMDFVLQSSQDDFALTCRLLHCSDWPSVSYPLSAVFDLINAVYEWSEAYQGGPITVIDRCGGSDAAAFCALSALLEQIRTTGTADVYQVAKLIHSRRPGVFPTLKHYHFLYLALDAYLKQRPELVTTTVPCSAKVDLHFIAQNTSSAKTNVSLPPAAKSPKGHVNLTMTSSYYGDDSGCSKKQVQRTLFGSKLVNASKSKVFSSFGGLISKKQGKQSNGTDDSVAQRTVQTRSSQPQLHALSVKIPGECGDLRRDCTL